MLKLTEIANELSKRKPYIKTISTSSSKAEVLKWYSNLYQKDQVVILDSPETRLTDESANDFLLRKFIKRSIHNYERQAVIVSTDELLGMDDMDVSDLDMISDEELDEMFADELDDDGNWKENLVDDED